MKRRDWRIKKLKKDTSGKLKRNKAFRLRRFVFLRELYFKKNNILIKKDYITNSYINRNLIINLLKKKTYIDNLQYYNNNFYKFIYIFPNFIFKKKVFNLLNKFKDVINENNLDYYSFKKNSILDVKNSNNKIVIFSKNNDFIDKSFFNNEDNSKLFLLKYPEDLIKFFYKETSFFINYNIYIFNIVELYKILYLLLFLKLK